MSSISTGKVAGGVFARTSSGLVRTVSTFDTFFYCLVQLAIPYVMFNVAYWVFYPGANMELAAIIALVAALGEGITYALFSSVYPRSGGEYVPLSRTTHPLLGFVASFGQTFWQIYYFGVNGAFAASIGVAPLFSVLGLQLQSTALTDIGKFFASPVGWFVFGIVMIAFFSGQLYQGMRTYFRVQKWAFSIALVCYGVFILVLILGSVGVFNFEASFNKYVGPDAFTTLLKDARDAGVDLAPAFDLRTTLYFAIWPAFSFLFAVLSVAFSGEIKNVERGQLIGIAGAQLVGGVLVILTSLFARLAISSQGLLAAGYVSAVEPDKFPLPYAWLTLLTSVMADNVVLTVIINATAVILITYVAASTAIYATRGLLAWGIDGMGPSLLGQVSERHRSPTYAILVTAVLGTIILAIYSFTDWVRVLSGLAPMGIVFMITTFVGMIFPFTHRKAYQSSPAKIEVAGIPLMTITGLIGGGVTAFLVYRAIVDVNYGANAPVSMAMMIGVFAIGVIWYFVARAVRKGQGVNMDARFEEIPIE